MIFVPLPLFATLGLIFILIQMVRFRDMGLQANQLFIGLVALYALQSLLLCLHWGYELDGIAIWAVSFLSPSFVDATILMAYLGFGVALLRHALTSGDALELAHIGQPQT